MELSIKVGGMKIKFMGVENLFIRIKMSMKVNFCKIVPMAGVDWYRNVVKHMKAIGPMISHMVKVSWCWKMGPLMMASLRMDLSTDMDFIHGPITQLIKATGKTTNFMAKENIFGEMAANILDLGKKI